MKGFMGKRWNRQDSLQKSADNVSQRQDDNRELSRDTIPETGFWRSSKFRKFTIGTVGTVLIVAGCVAVGYKYVNDNTFSYYRVYVDGQDIGTVDNIEDINKLYERKQAEYEQQYPEASIELLTDVVTTELEEAYKPVVNASSTLDKLDQLVQVKSEGVELTVNGQVLAVVKDAATADSVLKDIKQQYVPEVATETKLKKVSLSTSRNKTMALKTQTKVESFNFQEKIETVSVNTTPDQVVTAEQALELLTTGAEEPTIYTVKAGDTISSIAKKFGITSKQLFTNNIGVEEKKLQIGMKLNVTVTNLPLTAKTVETVTEEIAIKPGTEVRKSADLLVGVTKTVYAGQDGKKLMTYKVTRENGRIIQKEWLGQEVTLAAKDKVVLKGTKVKVIKAVVKVSSNNSNSSTSTSTRSSSKKATVTKTSFSKQVSNNSMFAWPVSGYSLSSTYGTRWNKMHKGIDIVSSKRTIMAAASGKVTFAGVKSGYGNCIVVEHSDGYETLYGHLKSISVDKGDKVSQGSTLGIMGSTGHSTGVHLHFEIHLNGSIKNPLNYLN